MEKMKAVEIKEPEVLRIIETDKPAIDETNNVLVKMKAAGICGFDIGIYHGTNAAATYPRVIGHEIVGEVVETYLNHPVNLGIGGAMQSGFRYARDHGYDFAAQIDGDGQHDPAYIRVIMEGMARDGADVGIGSRFIERKGF